MTPHFCSGAATMGFVSALCCEAHDWRGYERFYESSNTNLYLKSYIVLIFFVKFFY